MEEVIPGLWHLLRGDLSIEEHALDTEAEDDVEVVADLVRVNPDRGEVRAVDVLDKLVQLHGGECGEVFHRYREPLLPKGFATTYVGFPEEGLGLMNSERNSVSDREVVVLGGESLLIESVPSLMHNAKEGGGKVILIISGRESHVFWAEGSTEWVRGGIDTPFVKVEPKGGRDLLVKAGLLFLREAPWRECEWIKAAFFGSLLELDELWVELGKESFDFLYGEAIFIEVHEGLIGFVLVSEEVGLLLGEVDDLSEMGLKGGKVGVVLGLSPGRVGQSGGLGEFFDEGGGELGIAIELGAPVTEVGSIMWCRRGGVLRSF